MKVTSCILVFKSAKKLVRKKSGSGFHVQRHVDQRHKKTHTKELNVAEIFSPSLLVTLD